jgi:hypothetical protein
VGLNIETAHTFQTTSKLNQLRTPLLQIPYLLFTLVQCVVNVSYVLSQELFLSVASGLVITPVIFFRTSDFFFDFFSVKHGAQLS